MNKNIKNLKNQADLWAEETLDCWALSENEWNLAIDAKFAELIVRECAEFVENEIEVAGYKAKRILKHFGVEE